MALIDLFLARRVKRGTLTVHHADGKTVRFGTADPRFPDVTIRFTDAGAAAAIVRDPGTADYTAMVANNFADYRLKVGGLVDRPLSVSLPQLRQMPSRAQITRHDCVEGWSAIAKWQGPKLGALLKAAQMRDSARYIVFTCADLYRGANYYESIDLVDAFHPQTILAWALNDQVLDVAHGAPVRLRVERQLGYKHAKYVTAIDAVASLAGIGKGKGGYWEDNVDYDWYAGI